MDNFENEGIFLYWLKIVIIFAIIFAVLELIQLCFVK